MKKYFIILLFLIFAQKAVFATPIIQNAHISPSNNIWMGEDTTILLECYDNENKTIKSVYANITGSGVDLTPNGPWKFYCANNNCSLLIDGETYLSNITTQLNANIVCENNESNITNAYTSFTVSNFTGYIKAITPNPAYTGEVTEINFIVLKNNVEIVNNVNFNVSLDDNLIPLTEPAYYGNKGWALFLKPNQTNDTYNLKVTAFYDRANVNDTAQIEIRKRIDFEIVSLNKTWVESNENISLIIRAKDKEKVIDLSKNNLNIQIGSIILNIISITPIGDSYFVIVNTPSISASSYDLTATVNYESSYYTATKIIYYVVDVNGKFVDSNNKGISAQIKFFSGGMEKLRISTDSNGYYSESLPTGFYDVQVIFPESKLLLKDVSISDFNDPIKYFYSIDPIVPGIRNAGLFSYKVALTYDEADLEMNYEERNIIDESNLIILKCPNWNSGRKVCNDEWFEIGGDVDNVRNIVKVNLYSLSAFIIGERKEINVNFNLDNEKYYTDGLIKVRGLVKDSDGETVANASVKTHIKNTPNSFYVFSDNNGVFSFELKAPEEEGSYELVVDAEKYPYISFSGSKSFNVTKNRALNIVFPDTVKLKQGQNITQEISLVNVGQADLTNLNISLSGIPNNYYTLKTFIEKLKENEENKIYIQFSIPNDAEKRIYSVTLTVSNNDLRQEKVFGFTIIGNETTVENATAPSGRFILPTFDSNLTYIVIFAIFCFSAAIIIKKIKIKRSKRDDVKDFLFDVKDHFRKRKIEVFERKIVTDYKDLISSEFPNAKDKYGKNN